MHASVTLLILRRAIARPGHTLAVSFVTKYCLPCPCSLSESRRTMHVLPCGIAQCSVLVWLCTRLVPPTYVIGILCFAEPFDFGACVAHIQRTPSLSRYCYKCDFTKVYLIPERRLARLIFWTIILHEGAIAMRTRVYPKKERIKGSAAGTLYFLPCLYSNPT